MSPENKSNPERGRDLPTMPDRSKDSPETGSHLPTMPDPGNDPERGQRLPTDPDPVTQPRRINDPQEQQEDGDDISEKVA